MSAGTEGKVEEGPSAGVEVEVEVEMGVNVGFQGETEEGKGLVRSRNRKRRSMPRKQPISRNMASGSEFRRERREG